MSDTTNTDRIVVLVLAAVVLLVLVPLFGMGTGLMGGGHMWGDGHMWGTGSDGPGWLFVAGVVLQLLVLAVLVGGVVVLYRALSGDDGDGDEALEELRLAYARGDLTDEEFQQRRDRLERES